MRIYSYFNLIIFSGLVLLATHTSAYAELPNPFESKLPVAPEVEQANLPNNNRNTANSRNSGSFDRNAQNQNTAGNALNSQYKQATTQSAEIKPPALALTGVVWKSDRPQAIINGQVLDIGDVIADAKVVSIDKTGVQLSFQGAALIVKL